MNYILDESALYYMLESFPKKTFSQVFDNFSENCMNGRMISDKETKKGLENLLEEDESYEWMNKHSKMFRPINQKESLIMGELVDADFFRPITNEKNFVRNIPITIPFIIVIAIHEDRTIVMDKKSMNHKLVEKICKDYKASKGKEIKFLNVDDFLSSFSSI